MLLLSSKPPPFPIKPASLLQVTFTLIAPLIIGLICKAILHLASGYPDFNQEDDIDRSLSSAVHSSFLMFIGAAAIMIPFIRFLGDKSSLALKKSNLSRFILFYSITCAIVTQGRASSIIIEKESHARILQEERDAPIQEQKSISFSMGRQLGSLNVGDQVSSIILSRDEKTLYVANVNDPFEGAFGFRVIDVSNKENPMLTQTVTITKSALVKPKLSMILSHDEKILYLCNQQYFSSYNVSNPDSVSELVTIRIPKFAEAFGDRQLDIPVSLALSADGKTLFAAGFGLQVLDVSVKDRLKVWKSEFPAQAGDSFVPWTIAIQNEVLLVTNEKTFQTFNVADPSQISVIYFAGNQARARAIVLSKDKKMASLFKIQNEKRLILERVNVQDPNSPVTIKSYTLDLPIAYKLLENFMQSPNERYLFFTIIGGGQHPIPRILAFDLHAEELLQQEDESQNLIHAASSIIFTSDEKKVIAYFRGYISTIELYRDYPSNRIFSINSNTLAEIPLQNPSMGYLDSMKLSTDGKQLYYAESKGTESEIFIYDVSSPAKPVKVTSFIGENTPISIASFQDSSRLNIVYSRSIGVYDTRSLKKIGHFDSEEFQIKSAVFTSDTKICFAAQVPQPDLLFLRAFDFSDPTELNTDLANNFYFGRDHNHPTILLQISPDDKTLYMVHKDIVIYDVSNPTKLLKISSLTLLADENDFYPASVTVSRDGKLLFILISDFINSYLKIVDVSNPLSAKILSTFTSPQVVDARTIPIGLSPDGSLLYTEGIHTGIPGLFVLNITDPTLPVVQSVVHMKDTKGGPMNGFVISPDGKTAFFSSDEDKKIFVNSLRVANSLYIGSESFRLGEKWSNNVMVMKQSNGGNFIPFGKNYRFTKTSLFALKIVTTEKSAESKLIPLPYWMTFQKESNIFALEPLKQKDLGTYTLYSAFSTQVNRDSFEDVLGGGDKEDLLALLIGMGYLDNDLYVTKNFGTLENFILTSNYTLNKAKIYQILKRNCYETFTVFDILPSLDIGISGKKLEIQTPSVNSLKIEIDFYHQDHKNNSWVQFLNKPYGSLQPIITENKTKMDLSGTSKEVNKALRELVLNFENTEVCAGTLSIWDHLNPPLNRTIGNLSSYFEINEAPKVNTLKKEYDIQTQIDQIPISTGQYFTITLLEETFSDLETHALSFELALDNEEKSTAPSWLTIYGLNLKGTPPEELFNRKVNLLLIARNEFKHIEVPITLNIKISLWFAVKILARYSPYILTMIGLWVYANRIYNVLCKKRYRHRKDFWISIGEEITTEKIYPITFIGKEAVEGNILWNKIVGTRDGKEFLQRGHIDKLIVIQKIQEVARDIIEKDPMRLSLYNKGSDVTRDLIHQLVVNNWALWLLMNSQEEKETRKIFNEIKEKWTELVSWDERGYCSVIESRLVRVLKGGMCESTFTDEEIRLEEKGIYREIKGEINLELLKNVFEGHAMKNQNVWKGAGEVHIEVKEEVSGNIFNRFLKRNLLNFNPGEKGQKVGYGVEFEFNNDVLRFYGKAQEKLCGKTMVMQFKDIKQKILKEIWIHGVKGDQRAEGSFIELGKFMKENGEESVVL